MSSEEDIDPVLYILNTNNVPITEKVVLDILKKYDIGPKKLKTIKKMNLVQRAMVHRSYLVRDPNYEPKKNKQHVVSYQDMEPIDDPSKAIPLQEHSYERLEFLGDAVIHKVLADYLFHRYPESDEGFMTSLRTKIENKESLAWLSKQIGLEKYVLVAKRLDMHDARNKESILEDCFEAFVGAIYEESHSIAEQFVVNLIEKEIDFAELLRKETNYKATLLQYYHTQGWRDPYYDIHKTFGSDHQKEFVMFVTDGNEKPIAYGRGASKKKGEQEAAKNALKYFNVYDESDTEEDTDSEQEIEYTDSNVDLEKVYSSLSTT